MLSNLILGVPYLAYITKALYSLVLGIPCLVYVTKAFPSLILGESYLPRVAKTLTSGFRCTCIYNKYSNKSDARIRILTVCTHSAAFRHLNSVTVVVIVLLFSGTFGLLGFYITRAGPSKRSFRTRAYMHKFRFIPRMRKVSSGHLHSAVSNEYCSGQRMP